MLLLSLILIPLFGTFLIFVLFTGRDEIKENIIKISSLIMTVLALLVSFVIWFLFESFSEYFALLATIIASIFTVLLSKPSADKVSIKQSSHLLVQWLFFLFCFMCVCNSSGGVIPPDFLLGNWEDFFTYNSEVYNKSLVAMSSGDLGLLKSSYQITQEIYGLNDIFMKEIIKTLYHWPFNSQLISNLHQLSLYNDVFSTVLTNLEVEINKLSSV